MNNLKKNISKNLSDILADTRREIQEDKQKESLEDLQRKLQSAPPIISFYSALKQPGFGLIAEIKQCSPSKGAMNPRNVAAAAEAYRKSDCVRAISVLTSRTNFGKSMTVHRMFEVKRHAGKPVLRKDFIFDEYQVYQSRAYGADAILLMANVVAKKELAKLYTLATNLGMDVLFETHEPKELKKIPPSANIYGINSRDFCSTKSFKWSRVLGCLPILRLLKLGRVDLTVDLSKFAYCKELPRTAVKVAESGVEPEKCKEVYDAGFDAILVGTALLFGNESVEMALRKFEREFAAFNRTALDRNERVLEHAHA